MNAAETQTEFEELLLRLGVAADELPTDGQPYRFWEIALSADALRLYEHGLREAHEGLYRGQLLGKRFRGFPVVYDETLGPGGIHARLA